jgi:hypothetical protein
MKKWIQEELTLKLDFVNWEFEIGWIWMGIFVLDMMLDIMF